MSGAGSGKKKSEKMLKKDDYLVRLGKLLQEYPNVLIVECDNVSSQQFQSIRKALRKDAVVLMGKNTLIRKGIKANIPKNKVLESLLPHVKFNVGFVFTKGNLSAIREKIVKERVQAPAKAGTIAPNDVIVPAGPTGMEPTQTSFLQALNIASKINKGQVEIINDVSLISKGQKVGPSEAALLAKLNIKPFSYGLKVVQVYESGFCYEPEVLDMTDEDILNKFRAGVRNVAAVSLATGIPTIASVPHSLINGYKNLLSIALATDITFKQAESYKAFAADPSKFARAAPGSTTSTSSTASTGGGKGGKGGAPPPAAAKPAPVVEEPPAEEEAGIGGLFD